MSCVTAQLVQPFRDRPNEGSLTIYTEFSPMADPSFEPGRPGESAVELGRLIDRGLRFFLTHFNPFFSINYQESIRLLVYVVDPNFLINYQELLLRFD